MTNQQKNFADEYLIDLNATRAYKAAYPNIKKDETAAAAGARLLKNPKVAKYLDKRMKDRQRRTEVTQDKVINELAKIAFIDLADPRVIQGIVRPADKNKSLELLGKHLSLFTDKMEVSGAVDVGNDKLGAILEQLKRG